MKTSLAVQTAPDVDLLEEDGKVTNFGSRRSTTEGPRLPFPLACLRVYHGRHTQLHLAWRDA